jgi:ubiquitin
MAEAAPEPERHAQVIALRATLERAETGDTTDRRVALCYNEMQKVIE